MSTKDEAMTVSPNGQQTDVSGSFIIKRPNGKEFELLNYHDGNVELFLSQYGECNSIILSKDEWENIINWLSKNCR